MQTSLKEIAEQARRDRKRRFTNLGKLLNAGFLKESFSYLNKKSATGVDGITVKEYAKDLDSNVEALVNRVKTGKYRVRFVRRKYIRKQNGKMRPLGIPTTEDKLLQTGVARILSAIYEQDFMDTSYGYRPGRGVKGATKRLTDEVRQKYSYVVEADIRGFFDHLDHEWLMKMIDIRVGDGQIKRLIGKWLKAGILEEDGNVIRAVEGTPQGSGISPLLANVYLHYVLDLWFEKEIRKKCRGEAYLIRYADDFVALFRYKEEAEMYYRELTKRMMKFGLELAEEKTRIISFSRFRKHEKTSFSFLGIEYRWGTGPSKKDAIIRRTERKRQQRAFKEMTQWCRENRHNRIRKQTETMKQKLQGHYNYYGIRGNYISIAKFYEGVTRIWFRWLNRRSQRRSYTWKGFNAMLKYYEIPRPRITEKM